MSVKVANTYAAHNDGVALGVDGRQTMIATVTVRCDDHPNETLQRSTAEVFGVLPMQRPLGVG
jgi:hypothetical protein